MNTVLMPGILSAIILLAAAWVRCECGPVAPGGPERPEFQVDLTAGGAAARPDLAPGRVTFGTTAGLIRRLPAVNGVPASLNTGAEGDQSDADGSGYSLYSSRAW
jgi:hypothetical protein